LSMPIRRHFWKRQAWHDLRLRLVISQLPFAGQLYSMLPVCIKEKCTCMRDIKGRRGVAAAGER
jgi:hypothetical protein